MHFLLQSWLCGKIVGHFDPAAVALNSSSGYETPFSKGLMRWTVIAADILSERLHGLLRQCSFQASTSLPKERLLLLPPEDLGLGRLHLGCGNVQALGMLTALPAVHFPASIFSTVVFARGRGLEQQAWLLLLLLLQPAALIIDHGHFQYNNISLGLTVSPAPARRGQQSARLGV